MRSSLLRYIRWTAVARQFTGVNSKPVVEQTPFERYPEIENSTERRIEVLKNRGLATDEWIATEKVHGANFGVYSILGQTMPRFAKRSGIMSHSEHFFGYHILIPDLTAHITQCRQLLSAKLQKEPHVVLLNGELFGGKYEHPRVSSEHTTVMVGNRPRSILAVQNDPFPQYSPHLHFYAFDLKYQLHKEEEEFHTLLYDDALAIFEQVPNLIYAKPILRGPLSKIVAFNVETFQTTLPPQLGLGNYPLSENWAEGIVVRHSRRGDPYFDKMIGKTSSLFKIKSTAFQEISTDRSQGPRVDAMENSRREAVATIGAQLPALESVITDPVLQKSVYHLLDHVCHNRLRSVISKIGTEPFEVGAVDAEKLSDLLVRDALKDFIKEAEMEVVNAPIAMRREMTRYAVFESRKLVHREWNNLPEVKMAQRK